MNRRDFLATSAATCLLPALPAMASSERPVRIYCDGEGETYIAHSLDELFVWLRQDIVIVANSLAAVLATRRSPKDGLIAEIHADLRAALESKGGES